ncbi:hypothetical protein PFICI_11189 [Pestalotiopsis fici W106-1]|uniref:Uncharacterized protein n=1 Tax=Pestalotiopsis fici (strain W106-1 / CGMCC3.15140) TaxID=1229662 RepID=W3WTY3_PESFW|nr:uncharacterized protein PFICI_11189 [Pestalotiopsis fici W106-1]ETS77315.1 hypothetical protein PFICI_11189 [Pestalotiopsis fici W106-1]
MRLFTKVFLCLLVIGLAKLNAYTKSSQVTPAESHVLKTITYGVGAGLLVNTVCGIAAPSLDPDIPASESFMSCSPFGFAGSLIVARVYVFTTGGWGFEQWWYVNQLPRVAENGLRDALGFAQRPLPSKPVFPTKPGEFTERAEL